MEISYCNVIVLSLTMKVVTVNWYFFVSNKLNFKLKIAKDTFSQIFMYFSEIIYVLIIVLNPIHSLFSAFCSLFMKRTQIQVFRKRTHDDLSVFKQMLGSFFERFVDIHITKYIQINT